MANSNKNIVITPNIGSSTADPKIVFSGADASTAAQNITMTVYPANNGTLSIDGSAGQLFSVSNSLTGTLFSVNDISGVPSIEVLDTGVVKLAQYNGSVLIGTGNTANARVQIVGGVTLAGGEGNLTVQSSSPNATPSTISAAASSGSLEIFAGGLAAASSRGGQIDFNGGGWAASLGTLIFRTGVAAGGTAQPERMRVDASGNLLVGCTTSTPASGITILPGTGLNSNVGVHHASGAPSGTFYVGFNYNSVNIGGITQNGTTSVSYNTTSDARRKQNIVDAPSAIQKVNGIQVRSFDWISGGAHVEHGLVAQELQTVAPEAVHVGGADAAVAPWAVDQSKLVPTLVKALQEALAEIEALKARLTAANI
jgi:hypothetical protein